MISQIKKWLKSVDVSATVMLATHNWSQFFDNGNKIQILVTSRECWYPNVMLRDMWGVLMTKMAKTLSNFSNMSPTHFVANISALSIIYF